MRFAIAVALLAVLAVAAAHSVERVEDNLAVSLSTNVEDEGIVDDIKNGAKNLENKVVAGAKDIKDKVVAGAKKVWKTGMAVTAALKAAATDWGKKNCPKVCAKVADKIIGTVGGKLGKAVLSKVTAKAVCAFDGAAVCEVVGLGPEDPLADACAVFAVTVACPWAVDKITSWIGSHAAMTAISGDKACSELHICPK